MPGASSWPTPEPTSAASPRLPVPVARSHQEHSALDDLRAEARYRRERYDLYRARVYGGRPTTGTRLRELRRACELAEDRLHAARRAAGS